MGRRDEIIDDIQTEIKTGGRITPYNRSTRLGAEQMRSIEKKLTGETSYEYNKAQVLQNICEAIDHDERKDLRATKQLSVEGLKKVRESLRQV